MMTTRRKHLRGQFLFHIVDRGEANSCVLGGGKQLRAPQPDEEDDDGDSDDDSDEDDEEEHEPPAPTAPTAVYRPAGGKQFGGKALTRRNVGKQLRQPS